MTTTAAAPTTAAGRTTEAAGRLRTVLLADGAVTAAVGVAALATAGTLATELPGSTTAVRVVAALLVVVGVDVALAARVRSARLALAGTVVGEAALGWAVVSTAVVLVAGASGPVTAAVLAVAAVSVAFGVTELRLARRLRA